MTSPGLSFDQLCVHLAESGIQTLYDYCPFDRVVIRTDTGDHWVAACHRQGKTLVIDMGRRVQA